MITEDETSYGKRIKIYDKTTLFRAGLSKLNPR